MLLDQGASPTGLPALIEPNIHGKDLQQPQFNVSSARGTVHKRRGTG